MDSLKGKYNLTKCNLECNKRSWCTNFSLGKGTKFGACHLYASGCTKIVDPYLDYYSRLDVETKPKVYRKNNVEGLEKKSSSNPDAPIKYQRVSSFEYI